MMNNPSFKKYQKNEKEYTKESCKKKLVAGVEM